MAVGGKSVISHRDGGFDGGVGMVAFDPEVFEGFLHEIFNEKDQEQVFQQLEGCLRNCP